MNTTVAKVIAFELGVLIAILAWLSVAGLPGSRPAPTVTAAAQQPAEESFANVAPVYRPRPQQFYTADTLDYPSSSYGDTDTSADQAIQTYDEPIATAPSAVTFPDDYSAEQAAPNTIGTFPEPVLYSPYDWGYNPYFGYAQPSQIIIVSNGRSCSRHHPAGSAHFNRSRPATRPVFTPRRPRPANFRAGAGAPSVSRLPVAAHRVSAPHRAVGGGVSRSAHNRTLASR